MLENIHLISLFIQILAGFVGVVVGVKVALTRLNINYGHMAEKMSEFTKKIEGQVEIRNCDKMHSKIEQQTQKALELSWNVQKEIEQLKSRLALFDSIIKPHLATLIHSPEHVERDNLVDKFLMDQLSLQESERLDSLLTEMIDTSTDIVKRFAGAMLLARVRWTVLNFRNVDQVGHQEIDLSSNSNLLSEIYNQ
jgi:hypothetical protein